MNFTNTKSTFSLERIGPQISTFTNLIKEKTKLKSHNSIEENLKETNKVKGSYSELINNTPKQKLRKIINCFSFIQFIKKLQLFRKLSQNNHILWENTKNFSKTKTKKNKKKLYSKIKQSFKNTLKYLYEKSLNEDNFFFLIWDLTMLFFIFIFLLLIPLEFCFDANFHNIKTFEKFAFVIFLFDILLNFNKSLYFDGKIIEKKAQIMKIYLKKNFLLDLLAFIPIILRIFMDNFHPVQFLLFIKCFSLNQTLEKFETFIYIDNIKQKYLNLIKLIIRLLFVSHIFACIWIYIGNLAMKNENSSWMVSKQIQNEKMFVKYLYSLYFTSVTMNTVGYGDITSASKIEIGYSIIFIFIACWIFAYSLNSIGLILEDLYKLEKNYRNSITIINRKNISFSLRMKIHRFFKYIRQHEQVENGNAEQEIISKLSNTLKRELTIESYRDVIQKISLLKNNFSEKVISEIVDNIGQMHFCPDETIFHEGEIKNRYLYFLQKGEVQLFSPIKLTIDKKELIYDTMKNGNIFGKISFFTNLPRFCSARSTTFSTVLILSFDVFLKIIKKYPKDYEKFCELRDSIVSNGKTTNLEFPCYFCKKEDHLFTECPSLHYIPNKKYHSQKNYTRQKFERKLKKNNSLIDNKKIIRNINFLRKKSDLHKKLFQKYTSLEQDFSEEENEYEEEKSEEYEITSSRKEILIDKKKENLSNEKIEIKVNFNENINNTSLEIPSEKCQEDTYVTKSKSCEDMNKIEMTSKTKSTKKYTNKTYFKKNEKILNFESICYFENYFSNNNFDDLLKKYQKAQKKRRKEWYMK